MSYKKEKSILLLDLDVILDTRLATILTINDNELENIIKSGYHSRKYDIFENIDNKVFNDIYTNRDKTILHNAIVTPLITMMEEFSEKTLEYTKATPYEYDPVIYVNLYPYILLEEEKLNILQAINAYVKGKAEIELIDMSYEDITPSYLKDNISIYVTYRYDIWLETHSVNGNLKKCGCPEVTMLSPAIYFKKPDNLPDVKFTDIEKLASLVINLKLIPIEYFSCLLGKTTT